MAYSVGFSDANKERIVALTELTGKLIHWGWIPFVLALGWSRSNPRPSLIKLLSPLA